MGASDVGVGAPPHLLRCNTGVCRQFSHCFHAPYPNSGLLYLLDAPGDSRSVSPCCAAQEFCFYDTRMMIFHNLCLNEPSLEIFRHILFSECTCSNFFFPSNDSVWDQCVDQMTWKTAWWSQLVSWRNCKRLKKPANYRMISHAVLVLYTPEAMNFSDLSDLSGRTHAECPRKKTVTTWKKRTLLEAAWSSIDGLFMRVDVESLIPVRSFAFILGTISSDTIIWLIFSPFLPRIINSSCLKTAGIPSNKQAC